MNCYAISSDVEAGKFPQTAADVKGRYSFNTYYGLHPTHVALSLRYDGYYATWQEECVAPIELYEFLHRFNPEVALGDVSGKHSDVHEEFNSLVQKVERKSCIVQACMKERGTCHNLEEYVGARIGA